MVEMITLRSFAVVGVESDIADARSNKQSFGRLVASDERKERQGEAPVAAANTTLLERG